MVHRMLDKLIQEEVGLVDDGVSTFKFTDEEVEP